MSEAMKAIDEVRQALAMREAGYQAAPNPEHVAELLHAYDRAVAAERERCAKIVESTTRSDVEDTAIRAIAAEIRAAHTAGQSEK
jgi:hypothetical protein